MRCPRPLRVHGTTTELPTRGDRGFESCSLQRRVERTPSHKWSAHRRNSHVGVCMRCPRPLRVQGTTTELTYPGGPRVRILLPPAESQQRTRTGPRAAYRRSRRRAARRAGAQFPYCAGARNWSRALRVAQQHEIPAKYGLVLDLRVPVDQFLKIKGMVRVPGRSRPRIRSDLARRSEMISPAIRECCRLGRHRSHGVSAGLLSVRSFGFATGGDGCQQRGPRCAKCAMCFV
jgi:hypothetical protein